MLFDKTTGTGSYNTNYGIMIISITVISISSRCKPLKRDPSREIQKLKRSLLENFKTLGNPNWEKY